MGRFADAIRCHILEKYMSSYMRERNVDALLVLRNEDKWAMTGNFNFLLFDNFFFFFLIFFLFVTSLWCDFLMVFSFLVADVEVKEDGLFIRLRKETVRTRTPLSEFLPVMSTSLWLRRFLNVAVPRWLSL